MIKIQTFKLSKSFDFWFQKCSKIRPRGLWMPFNVYYFHYRRCIHCSLRHCCNSWCKEEFVIVAEFLCLVSVNFLNYLPLLQELVKTLQFEFEIFNLLVGLIPNYVARAAEVASGITLPILCFTFMPAYRKFCNEPDPDDLKLSKPKGMYYFFDVRG